MITGGTGSFGSAVLDKFLDSDVSEIRIFSRDEKKQEDLRLERVSSKLNFIVGDVRDMDSIDAAMRGVDYLFQAAALKQVPTCEFFPLEAVRTNILGSENVLEAAVRNRVKKMIVLSTDKAVYPINTMGMTKAIMEKLAISKARDPRVLDNGSVICATRYGNVMCSRGSIIPLFIKQIKSGDPITITDPKMTRYMMSLKDSVGLVEFAFNHGVSGDTFVQKSPAATILDLAKVLKEIFNASNEIRVIGARHGEKLFETLCGKEELAKAQEFENYYRIPADMRDMNYSKFISEKSNDPCLREYNSDNTTRISGDELKSLLLSLDYVNGELND
jgi:UDP-glucose 4-epimerase